MLVRRSQLYVVFMRELKTRRLKPMEKMYMNPYTGSVDTADGWICEDENGNTINPVEEGEVVEVVQNDDGDWVEVD